ncbi:MAG: DUF6159 family protein [Povalibacter sp.]
MFTRFARSWELIKASSTVLRQDKELLLFPLFSAIAALLVSASFMIPLFVAGAFDHMDSHSSNAGTWVVLFLFYLTQYFVIFFFNAALIGAALIRLDGGNPTLADGFRIASSRFVQILGYAAIAATVGLILRIIEERAGFIGRWIAGLLGLAFTVATFLTVPILVTENVGPVDAIRESATMLKRTWGENIIGNGGMGIVFFLGYIGVIGIGVFFIYLTAQTGNAPLIITMCLAIAFAVVALALIQSALQGVYSAALYRYATEGDAGQGFTASVLGDAFKAKN